ncbi:MAG: heparinase II/III domain-containing protein [Acutalibacteraceae bacterium]|jgi:hypothetical protein
MRQLLQKRTSPRQVFPFPAAGETVWENPPCFIWIYEENAEYTVCVRGRNGFAWQGVTQKNYLVPDVVFPAGEYEWNLKTSEAERGWISFTIAETAVEFLRPTGRQIFDAVPEKLHPRHLFFYSDKEALLRGHLRDVETLRRNIALALREGVPEPPRFLSDAQALPYREYFGRYRDFIDRNLVACALGYLLLDNRQAGELAKRILLTVCHWDPDEECSVMGAGGDEIGLSNARCLPAVYDLIYDLLTEEERRVVQRAIEAYAQQCEDRLIQTDYVKNPGDSHVGRLPAYLGEAAMILKDSECPREKLIRWLDTAAEIYGGIFPFYGGSDGSWAEGPFYASSYTKWYLPFFSAVDRFLGVSYLNRPFYQRFSQYLLHFVAPEFEIHPFGDGYWCRSEDAEWPGFFAQDPFRPYAERFGPEAARQKEREIPQPSVFLLHLLDVFLPAGSPPEQHITGEPVNAAMFPCAGVLSMQSNLNDSGRNMAVLARASRYGSASHSHADQGSFSLLYGGVALISPSGYYGRGYGSEHHRLWTNSTRAHNCILVDGTGQPENSCADTGGILSCSRQGGLFVAELDLSGAYESLLRWNRRLTMDAETLTLTVEDTVAAKREAELSWLLHSLSLPALCRDRSVFLNRRGIGLRILPEEGLLPGVEICDQFAVAINAGVPEKFRVTMPPQYHMTWRTGKKREHYIRVRLEIVH